MAFSTADFVQESTTTTGTGTYSLDGANTGYQTFISGNTTGDTVRFSVTDGTDWEVCEGVITSGTPDTLTRGTVLASSNAGSAVSWGAGSKTVSQVFTADEALNIAQTDGTLAQFAATTSAQLAGVISDETGSGALVFGTSPSLTTPNIGTPSAGTLTNCTSLPISTGVSGLGTGVATFLATPSSANLASAVTDETGSGALVFGTSPALTSPTMTGTILEDVFALSGTTPALDPDNGSVQTHTLSGTTTYSDSLAAGEAITLMIDDGTANTVTWPTMTWVNNAGSAPTLATTGYTVVALWKVSTTLYGALVGDGT